MLIENGNIHKYIYNLNSGNEQVALLDSEIYPDDIKVKILYNKIFNQKGLQRSASRLKGNAY